MDPLQMLFDGLLDHLSAFLPERYRYLSGIRNEREAALAKILTAQQWEQLEQLRRAEWDCILLEEQAIFREAFSMARKLLD